MSATGRKRPRSCETAASVPTAAIQPRVQTKFLRLTRPPSLGAMIDGWRVCWLGGWDRGRIFFVVMVERLSR